MAKQLSPPKPPPFFQTASEIPRVGDDSIGEPYSSSFLCTTELQRLPSNPCKLVLLSNWNTDVSVLQNYAPLSANALYEDSGFEIYYGFKGVLAHQLFPSQSSPFLPVSNTDMISVRVRAGAADRYVWFSWFS